uniref:Uncharacterized protein n=1 Tax=Meloidogyne enterolobii TaxID=390850 RepID=A0A6V7VYG6_MELEN|nr:unnamed protein product [Meloidogyne enterolobii]
MYRWSASFVFRRFSPFALFKTIFGIPLLYRSLVCGQSLFPQTGYRDIKTRILIDPHVRSYVVAKVRNRPIAP